MMFRSAVVMTMLAVAAHAASLVPSPSFRYSYTDGDHPQGGVAQFYNGPTDSFIYNWGYQFPGQSHSESKSHNGNVEGTYSFVDANGQVQQARYSASPSGGFNVEQTPGSDNEAIPVVPHEYRSQVPVGQVSQFTDESQVLFSALASKGIGLDSGSRQAIEAASPTLLAAVRAGMLEPLRGTGNELVFRVTDQLVNDARGSVSSLANLLDADPIAARHDQQTFRSQATLYSADAGGSDRAILDTDYLKDGPIYIVRVPYRT